MIRFILLEMFVLVMVLVWLAACTTLGLGQPTFQQSLDATLKDATTVCEVVTSPEAANAIKPEMLAAAKHACNIAERAIIAAETDYAASKLAADPGLQQTKLADATANLATAKAQVAAAREASK